MPRADFTSQKRVRDTCPEPAGLERRTHVAFAVRAPAAYGVAGRSVERAAPATDSSRRPCRPTQLRLSVRHIAASESIPASHALSPIMRADGMSPALHAARGSDFAAAQVACPISRARAGHPQDRSKGSVSAHSQHSPPPRVASVGAGLRSRAPYGRMHSMIGKREADKLEPAPPAPRRERLLTRPAARSSPDL